MNDIVIVHHFRELFAQVLYMAVDGSVDIYFGPSVPEGKESNWVKTDPAKGFFVVFRYYGPMEGYIDKSWMMNDFEQLQ